MIPAFLAGGIAAALVAVVVGAPALRLKGIYFAVGTLALAEALRLTVGTILPRISRLPGAELRAYDLTPRYFLFLIVVVAIAAVIYWLRHSKLGLGMMASREDEDAARSIGVDTFRYPLVALVLSASLAGFVGAAFAYYHVGYYLAFTYSPEWTFDALLVTFVGGIGTLAGPTAGGAVLRADQRRPRQQSGECPPDHIRRTVHPGRAGAAGRHRRNRRTDAATAGSLCSSRSRRKCVARHIR